MSTIGHFPVSPMRVSQFEIYRRCQRVLEGLGAPDGIDREGAEAVAWLEARGLPGLALLVRDLPRLLGGFGPLVPRQAGAAGGPPESMIDLAGQSAVACGGLLVEHVEVEAAAATGGTATLRLARCRAPLFLLPFAVGRAAFGRGFAISWTQAGGDIGGVVRSRDDYVLGGAETLRDRWMLAPMPVAVTIVCRPADGGAALPDKGLPFLDAALVRRRHADSLAEGIEVDDSVWQRLGEVAARVLVPATADSRARGAGGGDANA